MTDEARPHGPFTAAIAVMLAPDEPSKRTRERMAPALEGAGIPASFAGIVADAMMCASRATCNATCEAIEPTFAELRAKVADLQERLDAQDGDARPLSPDQAETASVDRVSHWPPEIRSRCADCEVGTLTLGERYMVHDDLWAQAWKGRAKAWQHRAPGQMILCIGCLEQRLGRELCAADFTDVPLNDPDCHHMSARLLDRLRRPSARNGKPASRRPRKAPAAKRSGAPRSPRTLR
jgi:hypothetical protein